MENNKPSMEEAVAKLTEWQAMQKVKEFLFHDGIKSSIEFGERYTFAFLLVRKWFFDQNAKYKGFWASHRAIMARVARDFKQDLKIHNEFIEAVLNEIAWLNLQKPRRKFYLPGKKKFYH